MNKEIKELISRYNEGYDKLQDALREIPLEVYDFKPAKNKWSIREIIAESGSTVTTYDQDLWAANLHYASRSIDSNMELFKNICLINIALFLDIDEDAWDRFIIHPERGKIILKDYVQLEIEHVDVHIRQIKRNLAAWNEQTH
jgi:hypothetical protein